MPRQSRLGSAIEANTNTLVGFGLSFAAGFFIYPWLGWQVSTSQNLGAVLFFTILSIFRNYWVRRGFNWWNHRGL